MNLETHVFLGTLLASVIVGTIALHRAGYGPIPAFMGGMTLMAHGIAVFFLLFASLALIGIEGSDTVWLWPFVLIYWAYRLGWRSLGEEGPATQQSKSEQTLWSPARSASGKIVLTFHQAN